MYSSCVTNKYFKAGENMKELVDKIINGYQINKEEAMQLWEQDVEELSTAANQIRSTFCGNTFDFCTIVNGKSGNCSEDCKFCAQSAYHNCKCDHYPLLDKEELLKHGLYNEERGIMRYSVVTSGKRLSKKEVDKVCSDYRYLKEHSNLSLCASHGLLDLEDFKKLKAAGVSRIHNNLESSRRYFAQICTTHTYDDKINAIRHAKEAGLEVCSGGIIGMGETKEDRVDMTLQLRELNITSVPVNVLQPIPGTELEDIDSLSEEEIRKTTAIFRFILPDAVIRTAGGRILMSDGGESLFAGGVNGAITGDMLTTSGSMIEQDKQKVRKLGFDF